MAANALDISKNIFNYHPRGTLALQFGLSDSLNGRREP
jgi:hypothetical protein